MRHFTSAGTLPDSRSRRTIRSRHHSKKLFQATECSVRKLHLRENKYVPQNLSAWPTPRGHWSPFHPVYPYYSRTLGYDVQSLLTFLQTPQATFSAPLCEPHGPALSSQRKPHDHRRNIMPATSLRLPLGNTEHQTERRTIGPSKFLDTLTDR